MDRNQEIEPSPKSYGVAVALSMIFGVAGIHHFYLGNWLHRFYVGKIGTGILMLLTLGGLGIWTIIDFVMIVVGSFRDKQGRPLQR